MSNVGVRAPSNTANATTQKKHKLATLTSFSGRSSSEPNISAFRALALSPASTSSALQVTRAQTGGEQQASSSKSDIYVSIRSARVDPVQLIKSLTSKGSKIARRTANYVASSVSVPGASSSSQSAKTATADKGDDGDSSLQSPSFCMTDHTDFSESYDDMSFYDYDDDFSSTNNDEEDYTQHQLLDEKSSESDDPAAIQFELAISFQGRKYTALREFSTFVKLRNDLLRESGDVCGNGRRLRHHMHRTHKSSKSSSDLRGSVENNDGESSSSSVPELPTVTPENAGHGGFAWTAGVARSGFALLQATAKLYCPEMEKWLRHVVDKFPYSPSLSRFLWEPLASSSASWDTESNIAEEEEEEVDGDGSHTKENAANYVASKPPLYSQSKNRPSNSPRKTSRFISKNSCGSLNSIEEVHNEFDRSEEDDW